MSLISKDIASPTIFDVGAHHGESIKRYKKLFPTATIHAFEPDVENFKILKKNWSDNGSITLNNLGISASKGTLTLHRNLKSDTTSFHKVNVESEWAKRRSAHYNASLKEYTEKSYNVPVVNLDSYIEENNILSINLLKIDTQGHEDEVLKGAKKTLEKGIINVIETLHKGFQ